MIGYQAQNVRAAIDGRALPASLPLDENAIADFIAAHCRPMGARLASGVAAADIERLEVSAGSNDPCL